VGGKVWRGSVKAWLLFQQSILDFVYQLIFAGLIAYVFRFKNGRLLLLTSFWLSSGNSACTTSQGCFRFGMGDPIFAFLKTTGSLSVLSAG
jgi:hypothetical protein